MISTSVNDYLITGATSDIGYALLEYLAGVDSGKVLAVSRSTLDKDRAKLPNESKCIEGIDLLDPTKLNNLKHVADEYFKAPFTLIHCVGDFWHHKPLIETSFDEASRLILSHYLTLFNVSNTLLPLMIRRKGGRILAFSCNSVGYNYPDMAAFTSAKAAVETLIKCIANEYSKYNIIANALALSTVRTDKVVREKKQKYHKHYMSTHELSELIIESVTNSSKYINGNVIKLLKYSPFYYKEGYYKRNPIHLEHVPPIE
jgi:short-subunit dehydrogenase